jgi:hypothetical protein
MGDPMASVGRQLQMADRIADIRFHCIPEESGVALRQIGRIAISKFLIYASLSELLEKCPDLARIERVPELSDQVGSPQQPRLRRRFSVICVVWYRKPCQLDCRRDAFGVD